MYFKMQENTMYVISEIILNRYTFCIYTYVFILAVIILRFSIYLIAHRTKKKTNEVQFKAKLTYQP
jgi:hypothetical protein